MMAVRYDGVAFLMDWAFNGKKWLQLKIVWISHGLMAMAFVMACHLANDNRKKKRKMKVSHPAS